MKKNILFLVIAAVLFNSYAFGEVVVGDVAPDFSLNTIDGDKVNLSDFKGQPILLNFFHYN